VHEIRLPTVDLDAPYVHDTTNKISPEKFIPATSRAEFSGLPKTTE